MGLNRNLGNITEVIKESGGNIGIGTPSPYVVSGFKTLAINNSTGSIFDLMTNGTTVLRQYCVSNTAVIEGIGATSIATITNGVERMRILSSGNVGIGTNDPKNKLVISNGGAQGLEIGADATYNVNLAAYNRSTSSYIPFRIDASSYAFLTGNVYIGPTPSDEGIKLLIEGSNDILRLKSTVAAGRSTMSLVTNGYDWEVGARGSSASPPNAFYVYNNDTSAYRLVISQAGNVLIGTQFDDGQKLQVDGNISTSTAYGSSRRVTITALNTDFQIFPTAFSGLIVIRDNTNGGSGVWLQDPNMGSIQIANNMPGTWSISYNFSNGTTNIRKTSGSTSILLGIAFYGNG